MVAIYRSKLVERSSMQDRNANKSGYKKTKAGWIPEDWNCVALEEVAYVQTGLAKNKKNNLQNPTQRPYLRVANVQDNYLDLNEVKTIEVDRSNIERYLLKYGDVLFTEGGDFDKLGRGTIWRNEIENCLHQNHVFAVRCKNESLDRNFLSAISSSHIGKRYFILSSKQSTNLASINSTQLKDFPLPLPKLSEQKKITEILAAWDDRINQTRKLIAIKKRHKKALMQQLLGGFNNQSSGIEGQWLKCRLKDVATVNSHTLPESTDPSFRFFYIDIASINGGQFQRNEKMIQFASAPSRARRLFSKGDIIMSTVRPMLKNYLYVDFDSSKYVCSTGFAVIEPAKDIFGPFLYQLLYSDNFQRQCYASVAGSNYPAMSQHDVETIKLCIPGMDEQRRTAGILLVADEEIKSLQNRLLEIEKQKRGLMQKLLTGEVRVKV